MLGVSRTASKEEIKDAFIPLSKKYHPDLNQGKKSTDKTFMAVSEAYQTLVNSKKREIYDSELRVAETYRTQYERRFYNSQYSSGPFESQNSAYSSGAGAWDDSYYNYDERDVDWTLYRKAVIRPGHHRMVVFLIAVAVVVPTAIISQVLYSYHKHHQELAIAESERNLAAYQAVRQQARSSSVQEQLDRLVQRQADTMKTL